MIQKWNKTQLIKIFFFTKLALLTASVLFLFLSKSFEIGEKKSIAKENSEEIGNTEEKDKKESEDAPNSSADMKENKTDNEVQIPAEKEEKSEIISQTTFDDKNLRILDGLLELPALKTDDPKTVGRYLSMAERAKQQIDDRIKLLEKKAKYLKDLELSVTEKLANLQKERDFFTQTIQNEKVLEEDRLKELTELYEKMDPKKAALFIEKIDKDLVVGLFKKLKKKQVTSILENMQSAKSVEITEYFGRVGSAKEYDILKEINKSLMDAFNEKCKTR